MTVPAHRLLCEQCHDGRPCAVGDQTLYMRLMETLAFPCFDQRIPAGIVHVLEDIDGLAAIGAGEVS
ncbi:hypothetical protein QW131_02870 [Roseibium salinum]|nr:hypothetical protein [Roseibium salinum]